MTRFWFAGKPKRHMNANQPFLCNPADRVYGKGMNTVGFISNLAGGDMLIILALALMFFGAKRLPELARGLGQAVSEFNKAKEDVHRQITSVSEPSVQPAQGIQEHHAEVPAPAPAAPIAPVASVSHEEQKHEEPKPQV